MTQENNNEERRDNSWHDMWCGHHGHHKHFLLRIILMLLLLGIVFKLGVKVGEFKSEMNSWGFGGYHYKHHMGGFAPNGFGPMMMYRNFETRIPTSTPR